MPHANTKRERDYVVFERDDQPPLMKGMEDKKERSVPPGTDFLKTPKGHHLSPQANGVVGHSPGGSNLMATPSKALRIVETSPDGTTKEIKFSYITHEKNYVPKQATPVMQAFSCLEQENSESSLVTITSQTRASQPHRKTQPSQNDVVGESAKKSVSDSCNKQFGQTVSEDDIAQVKWEWLHAKGYAVTKNAIDEAGQSYDPQARENLYAGSRVVNEIMIHVAEKPVLDSIHKPDVREIQYSATHSVFKNTRILSNLVLNISIKTQDNRTIAFTYQFDVNENRKFPSEFSIALTNLLHSLIEKAAGLSVGSSISAEVNNVNDKAASDDCLPKQLSFS